MEIHLNGSFTSPPANANLRMPREHLDSAGVLSSLYHGVSGWNAALSLLLLLIAYDQCETAYLLLPVCIPIADRRE
jgi:hypothetical protein